MFKFYLSHSGIYDLVFKECFSFKLLVSTQGVEDVLFEIEVSKKLRFEVLFVNFESIEDLLSSILLHTITFVETTKHKIPSISSKFERER